MFFFKHLTHILFFLPLPHIVFKFPHSKNSSFIIISHQFSNMWIVWKFIIWVIKINVGNIPSFWHLCSGYIILPTITYKKTTVPLSCSYVISTFSRLNGIILSDLFYL